MLEVGRFEVAGVSDVRGAGGSNGGVPEVEIVVAGFSACVDESVAEGGVGLGPSDSAGLSDGSIIAVGIGLTIPPGRVKETTGTTAVPWRLGISLPPKRVMEATGTGANARGLGMALAAGKVEETTYAVISGRSCVAAVAEVAEADDNSRAVLVVEYPSRPPAKLSTMTSALW